MWLSFLHCIAFIICVTNSAYAAVAATTKPTSNTIIDLDGITTKSELGQNLLASARRLDDGVDYTWMADFSLKFQGCNHIKNWNEDYEEGDDNEVRISTTRLIRFRLCPTSKCSDRISMGCTKGFGDYIVDINSYLKAYLEAKKRQDEYVCQTYLYKHCDCEDSDDKGDDFDRDMCEYQCYTNGRKKNCIERNPYYDDDDQRQDDLMDDRAIEQYFEECTQFRPPDYDDDNYGRRLEDGEEDNDYYIGTYCGDQGGNILLGMFTDETCTNFADKNAGRSTFKELTRGQELPYSEHSVVRSDCISCAELGNPNQNNENNNDDDANDPSDACLQIYQPSGKCENKMYGYGGPSTLNNAACYYIEGIKIIRKDGIINTSYTRPNKVVSFFIFLFAVSFVLLGAFIYYLRMKLGMKINLDT